MSLNEDIRWEQRFSNYRKALNQLDKFIEKGQLSDLEKQGLIQAFEYTFELAWNTLKNYLEFQGITNIIGSRDTIREAFNTELITDGEVWMNMIKSRNLTSHSYNEDTAEEIVNDIQGSYIFSFHSLAKKMEELRSDKKGKLF
jgi:nucleotidyltransferase substrate binding protein (TIGR01987 family)